MKRIFVYIFILLQILHFACTKEIPVIEIDNRTAWPVDSLEGFYDMKFANDSIGYLIKNNSRTCDFVITKDRGQYWETISEVIPFRQYCIIDNVIIGYNHEFFYSYDSGHTWISRPIMQHEVFDLDIVDMLIVSPDTIFVSNWYDIYKTFDGGSNWSRSHSFWNSGDYYFYFEDDTVFSFNGNDLVFSKDYGENWEKLNIGEKTIIKETDTIINELDSSIIYENTIYFEIFRINSLVSVNTEFYIIDGQLGVKDPYTEEINYENDRFSYYVNSDFKTWFRLNEDLRNGTYQVVDDIYYTTYYEDWTKLFSIKKDAFNIYENSTYDFQESIYDFYLFEDGYGHVRLSDRMITFTF